jgi:hypothetical protein
MLEILKTGLGRQTTWEVLREKHVKRRAEILSIHKLSDLAGSSNFAVMRYILAVDGAC